LPFLHFAYCPNYSLTAQALGINPKRENVRKKRKEVPPLPVAPLFGRTGCFPGNFMLDWSYGSHHVVSRDGEMRYIMLGSRMSQAWFLDKAAIVDFVEAKRWQGSSHWDVRLRR